MRADPLLQRLIDAQGDLARSALEQPAGRDSFDYGRVIGMYAGLEKAKEIVLAMLADKDAQDF